VSDALREARRFEVRGVVQGVGFRPFVWRLAERHGVSGWVRNRSGVVEIHAEGGAMALEAFAEGLVAEAPPLARVDDVSWMPASADAFETFEVDVSIDGSDGDRLVSPDAATCAACLAELSDPADRRFRYPFINCTDCGPRFTIIEALPYDRERTSMRAFPMCVDCRREYEDPADRRFHAEPVACPACGPTVVLLDAAGEPVATADVIEQVAAMLDGGAIVALKGLGGFHLACDATGDAVVARLRERKRRPDKPFAVMVRDLDAAQTWFDPTEAEAAALASWRAPIVLVRDRGRLASSVAPGFHRQGAMLPSTPLHHLLLRSTDRPLVMTSGNATDEPICIANDEAIARLRGVADAFVVHDRGIVSRYDDSVVWVRPGDRTPSVLRRARGAAPAPVELAVEVRAPILGTGAELHGAFCLAAGHRAFLSQHVGDLDSDEAMAGYRAAFDRYRSVFRIEPQLVAHDLHPDLLSTRFAEELGLPRVAVQHHHAHVVATMAEHGLDGEVLGVAFDGLGLGDDGTVWGGELLLCEPAGYRRVGRLRQVRQPGGDAAAREPVRMALAHARDAEVLDDALDLLRPPGVELDVVLRQIETGLASPVTSSAGRLFDAIAALTGVCRHASFEGQPAILLEQAAENVRVDGPIASVAELDDGTLELDTRPLVAAAVHDLRAGADAGSVSSRFHAGFSSLIAEGAIRAAGVAGLDRVVLGGGVFHNDLLTSDLIRRLTGAGLRVFLPREVPVGDGGIAIGQVLVAHARTEGS
jgi:hydrogenase maturation protein HypF